MGKYTNQFLLEGLCLVLNERVAMVVETKRDQEIIYFNEEDKILTKED